MDKNFLISHQKDLRTYDNIQQFVNGQLNISCYTIRHLLNHPYFKKHQKLIAIDLSAWC